MPDLEWLVGCFGLNGLFSIHIYPLQRVFYPQNLACTPKNDKVPYMLLYTEGTKIRNKTKCIPNCKMQWEPCLWDSISVYIGPSPERGRKKREVIDERKKCPNNPHPHLLQGPVGPCPTKIQISRTPRH